jgi:hypothetical protein
VHGVECFGDVPRLRNLKRVTSDELERVVRLRVDIDADDIEASAVVANRATASTAEQVEQSRPLATGSR